MKHHFSSIILIYIQILGAPLAADDQEECPNQKVECKTVESINKASPRRVICEFVNEDLSFHPDYSCSIGFFFSESPSSSQKYMKVPFPIDLSAEVTMKVVPFYIHFGCRKPRSSASTILFHSENLQPDTYKVTTYFSGNVKKFIDEGELSFDIEEQTFDEFYEIPLTIYKIFFAMDDDSLFSVFPKDIKNEIMKMLLAL